MSQHFVQNALVRNMALAGMQAWARAQFWRKGTSIFVNSIPKAGTHLLTAELEKFRELQHSQVMIHKHDIAAGEHWRADTPADMKKLAKMIRGIRGRQIFAGHLYYNKDVIGAVEDIGAKTVFVYRDPRDLIVSMIFYAKGLRRHALHSFMNAREDQFDQVKAIVDGRSADPLINSMRKALPGYLGFLEDERVCAVSFEDLVGERGGGTFEKKYDALRRVARHCDLPTDTLKAQAEGAAKATATLRKGKANAWGEVLSPKSLQYIEQELGESIQRLGYQLS